MSLPRQGPICCGRPSKPARREGYCAGQHWWMEFYRCVRCRSTMLEFPVDGSAYRADVLSIRQQLLAAGEISEL